MPNFGNKSLVQLDTLDERLQALLWEAIEYIDFTVIQGARSKELQTRYYRDGKSRVQWPNSKHNCPEPGQVSRAADLAPYPIDWDDTRRFYALGGFLRGLAIKMDIPIRCGFDWDGDWSFSDQRFDDLGHVELLED